MEDNNFKLDWKQEFVDKQLEKEYISGVNQASIKYVSISIFALGIVYFLFIFIDYLRVDSPSALLLILINRTLVCLLLFVLYIVLHQSKNYLIFNPLYGAVEILGGASFLWTCSLYNKPNFLIQSLGLIMLVMIVYMLPNLWIGKVVTSVAIVAGFFIYGGLMMQPLTTNEFAAGIVFVTLILIIRAVGSYNNEHQRRLLFIESRKLGMLSKTDPMTGAYNRASLSLHIQERMERCRLEGNSLTLIILDIDDFKKINDHYGHLMGDKVLIDIVELVRSRLQNTDLLFRWGGEEFIVLLHAPLAQAEMIAENCRKKITEIVYEGGLGVSCSFGLTEYREGDNMDTILARADQKLYLAKANGKNRVEV